MVDGERCHSSFRGGRDCELRTGNDVTGRVDAPDGCVASVVDNYQPRFITLAAELRADVVCRNLTDSEIKPLAVE